MPLKRSITLPLLLFYGVGTMVGGGFYALMGKVAGEAGMLVPFAFLAATILALFTALSFAELSAHFPVSEGASRYAKEAFRSQWLATLIGWLVVATGVVSAATLAVAIVGFLQDMLPVPSQIGIAAIVLALGAVAIWGIAESVFLALIITVIEVAGLIFVGIAAGGSLSELPARLPEFIPTLDVTVWVGVFSGGFLAFYAFLGFEDMVSVAQEVKNARRNVPLAIILSLLITGVLYMVIAVIAVLRVPQEVLATSNTPMAELVAHLGPTAVGALGVVSLLSGVNGALVQIVMGSRVVYGMAEKGRAPHFFSAVSSRTSTPINATLLVMAIVLLLALFFPLVTLAQATSTIILCVFAIVNLSLVVLKLRKKSLPKRRPCYPVILPIIGTVCCIAAVVFRVWAIIA